MYKSPSWKSARKRSVMSCTMQRTKAPPSSQSSAATSPTISAASSPQLWPKQNLLPLPPLCSTSLGSFRFRLFVVAAALPSLEGPHVAVRPPRLPDLRCHASRGASASAEGRMHVDCLALPLPC